MNTSTLFRHDKREISFEVFPPKKTAPVEGIFSTIDALAGLKPDYISVTYGAGGSGGHTYTGTLAGYIKLRHNIESVAHLPAINLTKAAAKSELDGLKSWGIENILALRGDKVEGVAEQSDFKYAADLVEFIKSYGNFNIIGACYPEKHFEASTPEADVINLKHKVDAGVSQLVSQLFFDNAAFFAFLERVRAIGIAVPIEAGIMPVTSKKSIQKMQGLGGGKMPDLLLKALVKCGENNDDIAKIGTEWAINQIRELRQNGVDGIHLYVMNNTSVAKKIVESI